MRKSLVLSAGGLISAFTSLALPSQLSLSNQSSAPGTSIAIPLQFTSQGNSISGLQFDLEYDSSAMSLSVSLGDSARNAFKNLFMADLTPNKRRFLIVGFNQNVITDDSLINLFVNVSLNAGSGVYALKLSNPLATDPYGSPLPLDSIDGAVTVQETIGQRVRLQMQGVLNGASLLSGPVAPGEIVTLVGSAIGPSSSQQPATLPSSTVLAGTSVLFDGTPAALLYAAPDQINAVVPYEVFGKTTTQLQVTSQGQVIAGLLLSAATTASAIFTLDSTGVGAGAILNQDSTVNSPSNPADMGSVVSVFATGAGQTDPPGMDGQVARPVLPVPLLPVSIQIGGLDAPILYGGAAPGLVTGVLQVNALIPFGAPSGTAVPITLTVGPTSSPAGVTIAIK